MHCCINEDLTRKAEAAMRQLRKSDATVVTAESCTGGLVAACLTQGKDASSCFHGAFVVYTKQQKSQVLGVDGKLLREQGAVNPDVAQQMAEGALRRSEASLAIAITGVLGPDSDEDNNPPGLVYLSLARNGVPTQVVRLNYPAAHPDFVREQTVLRALELLEGAASAG
ncbi:MAG: CinA family protein [Proteobacteria bacterium]|nr:CinA family protein [Pseudomonadota bacterium]